MENVDTVVIGAGVVGLAAALAVARRGHSVSCSNGNDAPAWRAARTTARSFTAASTIRPGV